MLEGAWMGILLGGRGGCEAPPLLLLSLSLVVGVGGGVGASLRCCGMMLLFIGGLGMDIRLHDRNRFRFGSQ